MTAESNLATTDEQDASFEGLMTPEELAMWKKLNEKRKSQKKNLETVKTSLFTDLTTKYAQVLAKIQKNVVTIGMKSDKPFSDGNVYSISFGTEDDEKKEEIDSEALTHQIIEEIIDKVEALMGISNSLKVTGEMEGKKLFWQVRKRTKAE